MDTRELAAMCFVALGLVVFVVAVVRHVRREGADPFRRVHLRRHRLTPVMVLVPAAGYLLAITALEPVRLQLKERDGTQALQIGLNALSQLVGAALCLWVGSKSFRGGLRGFLLAAQGRAGWLGSALAYLLAAVALCELTALLTQAVLSLFDPAWEFPEHRVIDALRDPAEPRWAPLVLWLGAVVIAPVAEECFFRGMVQTMLLRAWHRRWAAILLPAVLFGLAHASQPHVVPALTLFGVILGIQYERSGSLIGPIAVHAMFNLKTLIWQTL